MKVFIQGTKFVHNSDREGDAGQKGTKQENWHGSTLKHNETRVWLVNWKIVSAPKLMKRATKSNLTLAKQAGSGKYQLSHPTSQVEETLSLET